jgi:hypothetical protein
MMGGMRSARHALLALLAVLASVVLAGCGGSESAASVEDSAASLAPADAQLFATIDADLDSDQWNRLDELLKRFPGRDQAIASLQSMLSEEGVTTEELQRALGPTVDVVVLDLQGDDPTVVALTKTDDKAALDALLKRGDGEAVSQELEDGWTAFSDEQASIDALRNATGDRLADDDRFREAMGKLPDAALAKLYVNGTAVTSKVPSLGGLGLAQGGGKLLAISAAAVAEDDGLALRYWTKSEGGKAPPDVGELLEDVPDGVIAFLNVGIGASEEDLREALQGVPGASQAVQGIEQGLGVSLGDLAALLEDELVLYVRPGSIIPEVTLVTKTDEERGRRTVDSLLSAAAGLSGGQTRQTTVDGLQATEAVLGPVSLYAVSYDGRVVVSTLPKGIQDLRGDGDRLHTDGRYQDALKAAGVQFGDDVFLYVDVDEVYGLVERLAQLAGAQVPQDARANVDPLRAVVVSGRLDKDEAHGSIFVAVD